MAEYTLAGFELETPLVNAAGSVSGMNLEQILRDVNTLRRTAIGAITAGSFTIPEQAGNEAEFGGPVYYHDPKTGATYNAMGLPNTGLVVAQELLPEIVAMAHENDKPVIASVVTTLPSPTIGGDVEQLVTLVRGLQASGVDMIEVNPGSPNTVLKNGGRKPSLGHDLAGMERLVAELEPLAGPARPKLGFKLPPYLTEQQKAMVPDLARLFRARRIFDFLVVCNSIPNQRPLDENGRPILAVPGGLGGMSGPATKQTGREQLQMWKPLVGDAIDIVSALGVESGKEMAIRRELGAAAAGGVTFLSERRDWGPAVTDMVSQWAEAEGLS